MLDITQATLQGPRDDNEDRAVVHVDKNSAIVAVFDGHGGPRAAHTAALYLPAVYEAAKKLADVLGSEPVTLLRTIFLALHRLTENEETGTTASVAYIPDTENPTVAYVAVLGDSPVIIRTDATLWVSPEHNIRSNQAELSAALARGAQTDGFYIYDGIPNPYVNPGLQMSRALGDKGLAKILSREPEVFAVAINKNSYILVASDGLLSPNHTEGTEQVGDIVKGLDYLADYSLGAKAVVESRARSAADNVTAVLVRFYDEVRLTVTHKSQFEEAVAA